MPQPLKKHGCAEVKIKHGAVLDRFPNHNTNAVYGLVAIVLIKMLHFWFPLGSAHLHDTLFSTFKCSTRIDSAAPLDFVRHIVAELDAIKHRRITCVKNREIGKSLWQIQQLYTTNG